MAGLMERHVNQVHNNNDFIPTASLDGLYSQDISRCVGVSGGLTFGQLGARCDALAPHIEALKAGATGSGSELLQVPFAREDIARARDAFASLCENAKKVVFFGTGGSSLGGQALAQLGGWGIPGDERPGQKSRPRTRFYDNLDPRTLEASLSGLDLERTRFVIVSKSGNTAETLSQAIIALQRVKDAGLGDRAGELFLGLTEPRSNGVQNGLRDLFEAHDIPIIEHNPQIGGRYSVLTNVGLLAAMARGVDCEKLREGAAATVAQLFDCTQPEDCAPALGAALSVGLVKDAGIREFILMPYVDRLGYFAKWYTQLWAESIGKDGEGSVPVAALGPVDQHSQLQLYMDGPPSLMITFMRLATRDCGPRLDAEMTKLAGLDFLAGRTVGDLVDAQAHAVPEALRQVGRPVRLFDIPKLDEKVMGALLMHFMLETIFAGRLLGINPFDQPAVEAGKRLARAHLRAMSAR